jgi:dipeptidyl aminopeptidase/acylaminoacyl peptidase
MRTLRPRRLAALLVVASLPLASPHALAQRRVPSIDDLLSIKGVGAARISPDGTRVAYTVTSPDFEQDAFVTHVWVVTVADGERAQLTRGPKSATGPQWSPDGRWLAFTSSRAGDKNQVFAIRPDGGEAVQLTKIETGVNAFAWSPDGTQIAFTAEPAESQAAKDRKGHLGDFQVVRRDYGFTHLFTIAVAEALEAPSAGRERTKGREFSVGGFDWSPDGTRIAFSAARMPDLAQADTADLYVLTLAEDRVAALVTQSGPDTSPDWSPDGSQLAFESAMGRPDYYHANGVVAVVPAGGGTPRAVSGGIDEDPGLLEWNAAGLFVTALQKTASHLFRVDPVRGTATRLSGPDALMGVGYSLSRDGASVAFVGLAPDALPEVFAGSVVPFAPRRLTQMSDQIAGLALGVPEVISWTSRDGASIEGVLVKPADVSPGKKYPLLVQIHGGPTGIDRPRLIDNRYYPTDAWIGRGALVLKVNYRGSAGYGERFRQLNVRNLGVGDAWDVLSGVDHLVAKGWVDGARVGCMGWSQGGYISAFLTTTSTRCAAVSVGAGISNWATYYYNTDITPFTIQYLGDDPADDPEVYRKTSPMSFVTQAKTPTLIQHGENDRRVPIANAYELRQGLEDRGVPVEMVVYKGFGHGITKPKAMRAVMQHNLDWFNHYLWGDALPSLTEPAVPKAAAPGAK